MEAHRDPGPTRETRHDDEQMRKTIRTSPKTCMGRGTDEGFQDIHRSAMTVVCVQELGRLLEKSRGARRREEETENSKDGCGWRTIRLSVCLFVWDSHEECARGGKDGRRQGRLWRERCPSIQSVCPFGKFERKNGVIRDVGSLHIRRQGALVAYALLVDVVHGRITFLAHL